MLDINFISDNSKEVKRGLAAKNAAPDLVDKFLELDEKWRVLTKQFDDSRAKQKKLGEEKKIEEARVIKDVLKKLEADMTDLDKMRQEALHQMPNLPLASAQVGKDESENKILKEVGEKPKLDKPKDYLTLAQELDLIDIERAAKVSGSRFGYLKGAAVLLEFALVDLALKILVKEGFIPVVPPVLLNEKSMWSMGYLERGKDEIYYLPADNLYLAGTSEQSVGPMHQNEIFEEKEHQFLLSLQEKLMQTLELPYRVIDICSGDLGDPAAAKYDIEVWLPGQNNGQGEYRETHSTSNTTDFQSRRLNIKYKSNVNSQKSNVNYVHML